MSCATKKPTTKRNDPDVRDIVGTTVLAIVCGFTRYVHINRLRNDTALAALLGLGRIVCEDSVRRALKSAEALRVENGKPLPKQRKRAEIHCLKRRFASSNCRI